MNSFAKGSIVSFLVLVGMLTIAQFNAVSDGYGPIIDISEAPSPYDDGLECQQFTHKGGKIQFICFDEAPVSVLGFEYMATTPAYYIEDGKHTSLF